MRQDHILSFFPDYVVLFWTVLIHAWMVMLSLPRKQQVKLSAVIQATTKHGPEYDYLFKCQTDLQQLKILTKTLTFVAPFPFPSLLAALPQRQGRQLGWLLLLFLKSCLSKVEVRWDFVWHWSCSGALPCSWAGLLFEMCQSSTDLIAFRGNLPWNSEVTWSWLTYVVSVERIQESKVKELQTKFIYFHRFQEALKSFLMMIAA